MPAPAVRAATRPTDAAHHVLPIRLLAAMASAPSPLHGLLPPVPCNTPSPPFTALHPSHLKSVYGQAADTILGMITAGLPDNKTVGGLELDGKYHIEGCASPECKKPLTICYESCSSLSFCLSLLRTKIVGLFRHVLPSV